MTSLLMMRYLRVFALLCASIAWMSSCEQNPLQPDLPAPVLGQNGAYILCEGLWRQDNATLSRYTTTTNTMTNDVLARVNPGLRLGDTASDMLAVGDTLYIAVSTSKTIEAIHLKTGVWAGRVRVSGRQEPRSLALVNDTTMIVSNLNDDSYTEFHPKTFSIRIPRIAVGPAPEGIAVGADGTRIFVANSGYGDFRANEPKAGTVSVLSASSRTELATLTGLPNVTDVMVRGSRLYALFRNLPSLKDSAGNQVPGGIVEYDVNSLTELRRWRVRAGSLQFSRASDSLWFLNTDGAWMIPLTQNNSQPRRMIDRPATEQWYGLGIHPSNGTVWICNARNYQVPGEVIIYRTNGGMYSPQQRFDVGLNPSSIVFF